MFSSDEVFRDLVRADVINQTMMLYALGAAAQPLNATQIQKTMFGAELALRPLKLATPRYRFIRYDHGPFCKGLTDDREVLAARGAILNRSFEFSGGAGTTSEITAHGRRLLDAIREELAGLPGWSEVRAAIEDSAARVRRFTAKQASEWAHAIVMKPDDPKLGETAIHDMPEFTVILDPDRWGDPRTLDLTVLENLAYTLSITPADLEALDEIAPDRVGVEGQRRSAMARSR